MSFLLDSVPNPCQIMPVGRVHKGVERSPAVSENCPFTRTFVRLAISAKFTRPSLQAGGRGFESRHLHWNCWKYNDFPARVAQFIARAGEEGMAFGRPDTDSQDAAVRPRNARSAVAPPW